MASAPRNSCSLMLVLALGACDGSTAPPVPQPARVDVGPDSLAIHVGSTLQLWATVTDSTGDTLPGYTVTWSSSDTTIVTVSATGLVSAVAPGFVNVVGEVPPFSDRAFLTVLTPVDRVRVRPDSITLVPGGALPLTPQVYDASFQPLSDRLVTWSTADPSIATVGADGMVDAVALGQTTVIASSEGVSAPPVPVVVIRLRGIVAVGAGPNADHTCVIDSIGGTYCWGRNDWGQLGNGTARRLGISPYATGITITGTDVVPPMIAVAGNGESTCAIGIEYTPDWGKLYCWGSGEDYRLGNAKVDNVSEPSRASSSVDFTDVAFGYKHACAVAEGGLAYCWGDAGGLGTGAISAGPVPAPVIGGIRFQSVHAGYNYTCGLGLDSLAYCWGLNEDGVLGGSSWGVMGPGPVQGDLRFVSLSGGRTHACGVSNDSLAYCWGNNRYGQLGIGSTANSDVPVPVTGGLRFVSVTAGDQFTCALSASGRASCWGLNDRAQLGTDPTGETCNGAPCASAPVAAGADRPFRSIRAGSDHICGIAATGEVWCWGANEYGQLGDGTTVDRVQPTRVRGQ